MKPRSLAALLVALPTLALPLGAADIGANCPWTTYDAEAMHTDGKVLGPGYQPNTVETESSHQQCVQLGAGNHVEFTASATANALVIRFSLPDAPAGGGTATSLLLSINGQPVRDLSLNSHLSRLYGKYPFSNDPAQGKPRNFYDEIRLRGVTIKAGDSLRLTNAETGVPCTLDLVDLEQVPPPLAAPDGALSLRDFGAAGDGNADDTAALRKAVAAAAKASKPVWVSPGDYKITGDIVLPSGVTIQGAGMWYTHFVGDSALYDQADRRVRFKLKGKDIHLADFAITGALDHRVDQEPNDGIVGAVCANSSIERIWIEHTKTGVWIYNGTDLTIEGCRFRDLLADGVNLCVGTSGTIVEDCSTRGTGDDCFAIWPSASDQGYVDEHVVPGHNIIRRCTGALPFLANGGSLYGGADNRLEDCLFTDIGTGCGILISTSFPTADPERGIDNNFSGTTVVSNCTLLRCGGYDHDWAFRGAMQIAMDRKNISGLDIRDVRIVDSFSDGLTVAGPGSSHGDGTLSSTVLTHVTATSVGLGKPGSQALLIRDDARGSLTLVDCDFPTVENHSKAFEIQRR